MINIKQETKRAIIVCIVLILFALYTRDQPLFTRNKEPEIVVNGDVGYTENSNRGVLLKATNGLTFKANESRQEVLFPNDDANAYAIKAVVVMGDGSELLSSELIYPGEVCKEVNLTHPLKTGVYKNSILVYKIYNEGNFVTQCEFPIEIKVV